MIKHIFVPSMSEAKLAKQIIVEARKHVPLDLSQVIFDWECNNETSQGEMQVNLVAVWKIYLAEYARLLHKARFPLFAVEPVAWSMRRLMRCGLTAHVPDKTVVALVDIGGFASTVAVFCGHRLMLTRQHMAGSSCAAHGLTPREIVAELGKSIELGLLMRRNNELFAGILLSGSGNSIELREAFSRAYPDAFVETLVPNIIKEPAINSETLSRFAVPIGLALRSDWSSIAPTGIRYGEPSRMIETIRTPSSFH